MLRHHRRASALCGEAPATKNRLGIAPRPPNFHAPAETQVPCRFGPYGDDGPEHGKTVPFRRFMQDQLCSR